MKHQTPGAIEKLIARGLEIRKQQDEARDTLNTMLLILRIDLQMAKDGWVAERKTATYKTGEVKGKLGRHYLSYTDPKGVVHKFDPPIPVDPNQPYGT